MSLRFSQRPGRQERHLMRRHNNPLFSEARRQITPDSLSEAQRLDHEEIEDFIGQFHTLVHDAVKLQPNEGSEVILELKERLDKAYEQACGLADDQSETKDAIKKLTIVVMNAVRTGAGKDTLALQELEQEEVARKAHEALLEFDLVADLLCPDSPIAEGELAATLLSTREEELAALLELFDGNQLALLCGEAEALIEGLDSAPEQAQQRMQQLLAAEKVAP